MRLPAVPVTSFQDATLNAEALQGVLTTPGSQPLAFPQLASGARKVYADFTISGLTWPGTGNVTTYSFTHGLSTPKGGVYLPTYIDTNGTINAYPLVRSPSTSGCTIVLTCTSGTPPNTVTFALYVLAILTY